MPERIFEGIGVSPGIAIGPAFLVQVERPKSPEDKIAPDSVSAEQARFEAAVEKVRQELIELKGQSSSLPETAAEEVGLLLDAHLAMISGSRLVRGALKKIADDLICAEWALDRVMSELAEQFHALKDKYISARIDDVEAVGSRLMRALMNLPYVSLDSVPPGGIVLSREISPGDAALLDPRRFAGVATVHGGAAGHTAIVTRALGLPAVLGLPARALDATTHGRTVIVDAVAGKVILRPSPETLKEYEVRAERLRQDMKALQALAQKPAVTRDGVEIALSANLELPRDVPAILAAGAGGIGLFRTEFLFMGRAALPSEDEQYEAMAEVVRQMNGKPVTFRTLDIGGDKLARSVGAYLADAANPALGLRAIRLSLKEPHLLNTQFRAMLRAGAHGPVRILLPLVTTAEEVERARLMLIDCHKQLKKEKTPVPEKTPPVGVMIEIPAAALSADSLAAVSDFFSLGTNDLIQYTIAIDRGNDQVASLYNPLNPAVLRLMEFAIEAGNRTGIPVSICGEMGADPLYTPLLLGFGIREFSTGYASLPRIKQRLSEISIAKAQEHARLVMKQYDPAVITQIVQQFKP